MAWLGEQIADDRPMTELVEEALYRHREPLFGDLSVAFFDTTSLYFEGPGWCHPWSTRLLQGLSAVAPGGSGHRARRPRSADRLVPLARQHCRRDHAVARDRAPANPVRHQPDLHCRRIAG
jgi:hypothetical protein